MESLAPVILGVGVTTAFHPVNYAKVLIQIGHEPLRPDPSTSLFGRKVLVYPNALKYVKHIKSIDGFSGLYRGLGPRIAGGIVGNLVSSNVSKRLKKSKPTRQSSLRGRTEQEIDGDDEEDESLMKLVRETAYDAVARSAAVIVSHPFNVIMVRSMAQFIGRETVYNNSFSAIAEIYEKDGIWGFFAGLVPRLLGEIATIWLTNTLTYLVNNYIVPQSGKELSSYSRIICSLITSQLVYPFVLVSNIMCVNDTVLAAGRPPLMPIYSSWRDCWAQLSSENQLKRGSSLFWRYYKGPVVTRYDGTLVPANPYSGLRL